MNMYGKLVASLVSAGAAAVMWLPASAGADVCTVECGGGVPGSGGLTIAVGAVSATDTTQVAEGIILDRLALNHNETVLTLA